MLCITWNFVMQDIETYQYLLEGIEITNEEIENLVINLTTLINI